MRRIGMVVLVGIVAASVTVPSFGRDKAALAAYSGRGNVDFISATPGRPDQARGTIALMPAAPRGTPIALGPAPDRGTVSLTAVVRRSVIPPEIVPPKIRCPVTNSKGTMFIAWSDGTSSAGSVTVVVAGRAVALHGKVTSGRFKGGLLEIAASTSITPGPPDCDASFSGLAIFAFPPSI